MTLASAVVGTMTLASAVVGAKSAAGASAVAAAADACAPEEAGDGSSGGAVGVHGGHCKGGGAGALATTRPAPLWAASSGRAHDGAVNGVARPSGTGGGAHDDTHEDAHEDAHEDGAGRRPLALAGEGEASSASASAKGRPSNCTYGRGAVVGAWCSAQGGRASAAAGDSGDRTMGGGLGVVAGGQRGVVVGGR
jgi:hypothetical protein